MSTHPSQPQPELLLGMLPLWHVTVEQYHDMIEKGVIGEDPIELIEGVLVRRMPENPGHRGCTFRAMRGLTNLLPGGYYASGQDPITWKIVNRSLT